MRQEKADMAKKVVDGFVLLLLTVRPPSAPRLRTRLRPPDSFQSRRHLLTSFAPAAPCARGEDGESGLAGVVTSADRFRLAGFLFISSRHSEDTSPGRCLVVRWLGDKPIIKMIGHIKGLIQMLASHIQAKSNIPVPPSIAQIAASANLGPIGKIGLVDLDRKLKAANVPISKRLEIKLFLNHAGLLVDGVAL
jgi:hypothetical protein